MKLNRLVIAIVLACLAACIRGESSSVEQVLEMSRAAYQSSALPLPSDLDGKLSPVVKGIEKIADGEAVRDDARALSDHLLDLVTHAGYTQRPSFTELAFTLREAELKAPQSKVLASRLYRLLAAEMSSTRFGL